ncbi:Penicillopepsin [Lachnellula willkommii]|uniref:Penicillopepsin n=1 Tax=Lachnellula willkommii TaxID=215461 RepID=A0A559MFS1_9HELO|nr:Penicillopepsin [Lachnellula willkommii]
MLFELSLLALAIGAQAAPLDTNSTTSVQGSKSFSAPAVYNPNFTRNGTAALLKAYAKHKLTPTKNFSEAFHSALSNSIQKRQDGSAPAVPTEYDSEYLVSTTVGGQKLNLDFDTGSADLWVFSTSLSAASRKGHSVYNPSDSSTYKKKSGYTWSIEYADGSGASGTVGTDTVTVGGTSVKGQAVELATKVSSEFVSDTSDGLVGLAFSSINTVSPEAQDTFFDNAKDSLDAPLFAAYLPLTGDGAYDFGYTDSSKYNGSIKYTDVDSSNGFWEYPSTSYKVNGKTHTASGWTAITDTGTTLLLVGDSAVDNYYDGVSSASYDSDQGGYTFPCSTTLPPISLRIGDTNYATVLGTSLNYSPTDSSGETCFGGIQSVGEGSQAIYGDVFLHNNYGVFDASGPKFGFASVE